ncbi:hypothetical protein FEZ41_02010 [Lentilactobacillus parafarraginis]|uniref:YfhO family protein n=1 Tax=Lentilactobacillus parafarraginis TaxID=390842 RepID=A0A5R9CYI5_9LACO|nr:hypothetical protein FEZ41_02010 [Lentilactobacillus parafarraginis]
MVTHKQVGSSTHENHLFTTRFWKRDGLILGSFVIFSILNVILFARYGWLFGAQDLQFHLQRIEEVYQTLRHLNFLPAIATYTFNQNGSAVMSLYPKLPLYPFALCRLIIGQPIVSYYVGMIFSSFLGLIIAFYSYQSVINRRLSAYIFAAVYMLSGMTVNYNFYMGDIGITYSLIFLPLAFAGLYHWLKFGKYKMLALGVTLICLSHVLNTIFLICTFVIITIINYHELSKFKFFQLAKAVSLTILLTISFWLPAFNFSRTQLVTPYAFALNGVSITRYLSQTLTNQITYGITLFSLAGFLLGIVYYRRLTRFLRPLLWLSIAYFLISSSLVPWHAFQSTPLRLIQFPWRLLIFPQFFLTVIFSVAITELLREIASRRLRGSLVAVILLVTVLLSLDVQHNHIKFEISSPEINYQLSKSQGFSYHKGLAWYKITNQYEYENLMGHIGVADYLPQKMRSSFDTVAAPEHYAIIGNTNVVIPTKIQSGPNQATISIDGQNPLSHVELPFAIYNAHYRVTLDGKSIPLSKSHRSLLTINHISSGPHKIHVVYENFLMTSTVILLSLFGLIMLMMPSKQQRPR